MYGVKNIDIDQLVILKKGACFYPDYTDKYNDFSLQNMLHCYNVAVISRSIGKEIGLSLKEQEVLYELGFFHDIGKSKIPNKILYKKGKLTDEEFDKQIKKHSIYSEKIYLNIMGYANEPNIKEKAYILRCHHENTDGTGYPDGLKCEKIPYFSRIIAIADRFEAITHPRIYRPYSIDAPLKEMIKMAKNNKIDKEILKISYSVLQAYIS